MGDTYAILALRRKRAHLVGELRAAERATERQRDAIAKLDAVLRVFEPASNPALIPSIRPRSGKQLFFRKGEQARLCLAALHEAGKPITNREVVSYALEAKGLQVNSDARAVIDNQIRQTLIRMEAKGTVRKIVAAPDAWWELVEDSH